MYKFEGKSSENKSWFDLDCDWIETTFRTREPEFYRRLFEDYVSGDSGSEALIFFIPIGYSKK